MCDAIQRECRGGIETAFSLRPRFHLNKTVDVLNVLRESQPWSAMKTISIIFLRTDKQINFLIYALRRIQLQPDKKSCEFLETITQFLSALFRPTVTISFLRPLINQLFDFRRNEQRGISNPYGGRIIYSSFSTLHRYLKIILKLTH